MPPSCHSTASFRCPVSSLSSNPLRIMIDPATRSPSPGIDLTNNTYDSGGPFNPIHAAGENNAGYDSFNVDDLLISELDAPAYWNDAWFTNDDVSASSKRAYQPEEDSTPFPPDSPPGKVRLLCVPLLDEHLTDNDNSVKELLAAYRNLFAKKNSPRFRLIINNPPSRGPTRLWMMKPQRSMECPFRVAQAKLHLPYTCRGCQAKTVADVRRHCIRNLPSRKPPHLSFLKLCPTCNEDFLHKAEYDRDHGIDGLLCETPRKQRKGDAGQHEQWENLCVKVENHILAQAMEQCTYDCQESKQLRTDTETHSKLCRCVTLCQLQIAL
jgi:hypothetical protein